MGVHGQALLEEPGHFGLAERQAGGLVAAGQAVDDHVEVRQRAANFHALAVAQRLQLCIGRRRR